MKRYGFILGLVALFCFSSLTLAAERTTVTKDSAGTMSHVSRWVTESGTTIIEVSSAGVSIYATTYNNIQNSNVENGVTGTGTANQIAVFTGVTSVTGRSNISGASVVGGSLTSSTVITTNAVNAGTSVYELMSGATLTAQQTAGGQIYVTTPLSGTTPTIIGIPTISGCTGEFMVTDLTGGGVTIQTTSGQSIYNGASTGTAVFVNQSSSRAQIAIKLLSLSGSSTFAIVIGTGSVGTWNTK